MIWDVKETHFTITIGGCRVTVDLHPTSSLYRPLQTTISIAWQRRSSTVWREAALSWSASPNLFRPESPGPSRNIHRIQEKR